MELSKLIYNIRAARQLLIILTVVFVCEAIVMALLHVFKVEASIATIANPILLTCFVVPLLYFRIVKSYEHLLRTNALHSHELRISNKQYNAFIESSKDSIMTLTVDKGFLYANRSTLEIFGCKEINQCLSKTVIDFSPKYQPDTVSSKIKAEEMMAIAMKEGSHFYEWTYKRIDGTVFLGNVLLTKMTLDGETVFQATIHDITKQKQVDKYLLDGERKTRAYLEDFPVCTKIVDLNLNLQYMSTAGIQSLGIDDVTQYYDRPYPFDFFPPSTKSLMIENLAKVRETGEVITMEAPVFDVKGNELWFHSTIVAVNDEAGQLDYFIVVSMEITARIQAEQKLQKTVYEVEDVNKELKKSIAHAHQLTQEATKANLTKSKFLANMSHEIRTPINGILGFAELLEDTSLNEEQKGYLNIINNSSDSLLILINDILDLTKIESGKLSFESIDFNMEKVVSEACSTISCKLQKGVKLNVDFSNTKEINVIGDPHRLKQVLINLLGNAAKFTEKGSINLSTTITNSDENNVHIIFSIIDTGIGIVKESLDTIFTDFSQGDSTVTRKYGGTGLGLTISKHIIEMLGGKIKVISKVGEGSKFYFNIIIPRSTLKQLTDVDQISENKAKQPTKSTSLHILVGEDNKVNQKLISKILTKQGHTVTIAEDGQAVVDVVLREASCDMIFMDMQMPVMDGVSATKEIRKAGYNNIPIIALTANAFLTDQEKCISSGMDDYLSKPIRGNEIKAMVAKWKETKGSSVF